MVPTLSRIRYFFNYHIIWHFTFCNLILFFLIKKTSFFLQRNLELRKINSCWCQLQGSRHLLTVVLRPGLLISWAIHLTWHGFTNRNFIEQLGIVLGGSGPWSIKEYQFFPKFFVVASLCSFICLQAVYQLSGPVCKATRNGCPSFCFLLSFHALWLISCPLEKLPRSLPMIVTPYGHVLYTKMLQIAWRFVSAVSR